MNRLQKFYTRQKAEKLPASYQKYIEQDEFKQKIKNSFSKLIVKQYLASWIKTIDQKHDLFSQYGGNFVLNNFEDFLIIVKGKFGDRKTVSWSLKPNDIDRNGVVVFVLIEEDFERENYQYNLILAGFLPTEMLARTQPILRLTLQDLLYSGGLKSYLTSRAGVTGEVPSATRSNHPEVSRTWICTQTLKEEKSLLSLAVTGERLPAGQSPKLASGGLNQRLHIWDLATGQIQQTIVEHRYPVFCLDFSPDGQTLALGSMQETIELWDLGNGDRPPTLQNVLEGHSLGVFSLHFTPDGQMLISRSLEETIKIWDLKTGELIQSLDSHAGPVWSEAISPDGKILAMGSLDESIKIWHLENNLGKLNASEFCVLDGHSDIVRCLAFSPDGKFLASGSADRTINIWRMDRSSANPSIVTTLKGHTDVVYCLAFSPDGKFLASGSADRTINIWRLGNQTNNYATSLEATLTEHSGLVWGVKFTPNGQTIISGSQDGTIKIWERC